jgi:hypothetical protein
MAAGRSRAAMAFRMAADAAIDGVFISIDQPTHSLRMGRDRNGDRVPLVTMKEGFYVATGFNGWGISNGTAAGMLIADCVRGRPTPGRNSMTIRVHIRMTLTPEATPGHSFLTSTRRTGGRSLK